MVNDIFEGLNYVWRTKRVWWYSAISKTRARFARTLIGGFWLGISNLLSIAALSFIYGAVFKITNFSEFVVYLGLGLVLWNVVANSFQYAPYIFESRSIQILNTNTNYIFYTFEEWAFQIQTFFQSLVLVLIGLSFYQPSLIVNLLSVGLLPLINLLVFIYWFPVIVAILGIQYKDFNQLIPIFCQLIFLLSPFLYEKKNLGSLSWTADLNPLYQVVASLRDTLISGQISYSLLISIFIMNIFGLCFSLTLLNRIKKRLPFLI